MMNSYKDRALPFFFFILIFAWFFNLSSVRLIKPDEGRYAEISREMNVTGDYLTPRIDGIKYFEKPPLHYWMTALFFRLFGEAEWTARLWSALCGAMTIGLIYLFTKYRFGEKKAFMAALILTSSPLFILISHINILDISLTFFLTLVLVSLLLLLGDQPTKQEKFWGNLGLWTGLSLGVLSKGLVCLVLPTITSLLYFAWSRNFKLLKNIQWFLGLLFFFLLTAPWFVMISLRHPEFFNFFFIHEHFARYLSKGHDRFEPIWYFIPIVFVGFLPWSLLFFKRHSLTAGIKDKVDGNSRLYLLLWVVGILVFFSISKSKLAPYILPIFPAMALLLAEKLPKVASLSWWSSFIFSLAGIVAALFLRHHSTNVTPEEIYLAFSNKLLTVSISISVFCLLLKFYRSKISEKYFFGMSALSSLLFFQLAFWSYNAFSPSMSGQHLAKEILPYLEETTPVYIINAYEHSVPFYLKRKIILVYFDGELSFGLNFGNEKLHWHPRLDTFMVEWEKLDDGVAILERNFYQTLADAHLPMTTVFEDKRWIVILRNPKKPGY